MKLLFITRKVDRADAVAGFSYGWVKALARQAEQVNVICLQKGDASGLPANVEVYSLGKERGTNRWQRFWIFQKLAGALIHETDGILAHQNPEYGLLIAPWAKVKRKPLFMWYVHKSVSWKVKLLNLFVTAFITASKESLRLQTKKKIILHHGIDTEILTFKPKALSDTFRILSVSRLSPSKRLEMIIEAVSRLKAAEPDLNLRLKIVGEPVMAADFAYVDSLRILVRKLGLESTVEFSGPIAHQDIGAVYHEADLMINCSQTGSLDKAVLEAMACGTIVLTANEAFRSFFKNVGMNLYAENVDAFLQKIRQIISLDNRLPIQTELRRLIERAHNLEHLASAIFRRFPLYEHKR